ncbi:Uncharacterised protein [Mycobacteroides abscessus subsp. abscessus]|nr:Uncharacterised protein [Mycobacteroides abscessus subsp. abscessus]
MPKPLRAATVSMSRPVSSSSRRARSTRWSMIQRIGVTPV